MPRVAITPVDVVTGGFPVAANYNPAALVAADVANKQKVPFTGREVIVAYNPPASGAAYVVTAESVPYKGRSGDLAVSLDPGEIAYLGPFSLEGGWMQTATSAEAPGDAGSLYFKAANAAVLFGVLRWPY